MPWSPARWSLRARVALAFLVASGVTLTGLGIFVHVRMADALDERLRESVTVEADRLAGLSVPDRLDALGMLAGDTFAQVLTPDGEVRVSSRLVTGPLLRGSGPDRLALGFREGVVQVYDDDAIVVGTRDAESERALLEVRRSDDGYLVVGTSVEDTDEALDQLRDQLLVGGALALVLAGTLGYVVAGTGLRPIERIRARAASISDRSAGERLPIPDADDELRRLAVTLNDMLSRLEAGLARERAFVAEASHELRTPLTLMLTEVEVALARPRDADELRGVLRSLQEEVRRLVDLAEDVLVRGATLEGRLPLTVGPVDVVALATRVVDRFREAVADRSIRLVAPRSVQVQGDATRLDRALSNLIDNAVRHGAGEVTVEVASAAGRATVTVVDEGRGPSSVGPGRVAGSGLGLGIVEEITRAHGGSLEIVATAEATRVRIELP